MTERLLLRNVNVTCDGSHILRDVTLNLEAGQIVGLVGPNGAGKSTLLGAIAGHSKHNGKVLWGGRPVDIRAIAFMAQNGATRAELTVLEVVLLGRYERLGWHVSDSDLAAAAQILEFFEIASLAGRCVSTLSGGQQQMVLLAQKLVREPKLLLLDEATSALDLRHQMHVLGLLQRYVASSGALVILAIHDLNLAARHADSIVLMHNGQIAGSGPFATVLTPQVMNAVYGVETEFLVSPAGHSVIVPTATFFHPNH